MDLRTIERDEALKQVYRLRTKLETSPQGKVKEILTGAYFKSVERRINIIYHFREALENPGTKSHKNIAVMTKLLDNIRTREGVRGRLPKSVRKVYKDLSESLAVYRLEEAEGLIKRMANLDDQIRDNIGEGSRDKVREDMDELHVLAEYGLPVMGRNRLAYILAETKPGLPARIIAARVKAYKDLNQHDELLLAQSEAEERYGGIDYGGSGRN